MRPARAPALIAKPGYACPGTSCRGCVVPLPRANRAHQLWRGLSVKVIDGTGVSLPDTKKNQRAYPQPGGQKPGCGFPLMKIVGVFSLATGTLLDYAKGNKHQHELGLLHRLIDTFKPGDLALADRGFSTYTLMALLLLRQVHSLFRLHHARPKDFRKGKRLGKNDRLLVWRKPDDWQKPRYMAKAYGNFCPRNFPFGWFDSPWKFRVIAPNR